MGIDFSYYIAVFWRRFPYFAIIVVLLTALGLSAAMLLPSKYQAQATLLVESKQIPDVLAASTVQTVANEQLQILQQRLMTRANLMELATRLEVFPDIDELSASDVVDAMREATTFNIQSGRNQPTFLEVSFRGADPSLVTQVTNEFVTMILDENVRMRTGLAGGTLEFFEDEVEQLGVQLDAQSAEILKFKNENINSLPENKDILVQRLNSLENVVRQAEQNIAALEAQKESSIALFNVTGSITEPMAAVAPEQIAVQEAQRALNSALSVFSESHPRIAVLRSQLQIAEEELASVTKTASGNEETEESTATAPVSTAKAMLDAQLADLDRKIADLQDQSVRSAAQITQIQGWLSEVPANTVVLDSLQRDYENTQAQYQKAADRLAAADTGERIERLSRGQRINVVEQATLPERPYTPNRPVIAIAGLGAGLFTGLALIVLLELLNQSIRRPVEISDKLGITPFAVLPYVVTEAEVRWKRVGTTLVVLGFLIGIPVVLWALHSFVAPLDPLLEKLLNKFGLTLAL